MAREHQLALPPDLVLLFKALITADGVLHRLDPAFDIVATLKPMLQQTVLQRYAPTPCASGCWPWVGKRSMPEKSCRKLCGYWFAA